MIEQRMGESPKEFEARKKRINAVHRSSTFNLVRFGGGSIVGPTSIINSTDPFEDGNLTGKFLLDGNTTALHGSYTAALVGGTSYTAGKYGQATLFSTNGDRLSTTLPRANTMSLSMFANLSAIASGDRIWTDVSGFAYIDFDISGNIQLGWDTTVKTAFSTSTTHHIVVTLNGVNTKLYLDGALVGTGTLPAGGVAEAITISGATTQSLTGWVDHIEYYDRELTLTEVGYLENQEIP